MNAQKNNLAIRKITLWGVFGNTCLMFMKIIAGVAMNSQALIADGLHSFSDFLSDIIVLFTTKASSAPADETHQFGHGKFDTIGSFFVGMILLITGTLVCASSVSSLHEITENKINYVEAICIAILSIIIKECLFRATRRVAHKVHSPALYANAWHHRSDSFSSIAVLIGLVASYFGYAYGDALAGLAVGAMVFIVGLRIEWNAIIEFAEGSISKEENEIVVDILKSNPSIHSWHRLRARCAGRELFMDVQVIVSSKLSVVEGHDIATDVEQKIASAFSRPTNVLVHIEPDTHDTGA